MLLYQYLIICFSFNKEKKPILLVNVNRSFNYNEEF